MAVLNSGCSVQITTVDEAKQFYPLFGLGANVALIFSGRAVKYFSQVDSQLVSWLTQPKSLQCRRVYKYINQNYKLLEKHEWPTPKKGKKFRQKACCV